VEQNDYSQFTMRQLVERSLQQSDQIIQLSSTMIELTKEISAIGNRLEANLVTLTSAVVRIEANEKLLIQLLQRRNEGEQTNGEH
jgi:hypothetical protein